jgi:NADH:ubiquinone reductase (H+-translocating)
VRKILIVGGGYAGLYTAWGLERRLGRDEAEITIVDPRPYMTYQPFLPEVLAGSIEARHAVVSLRSHLRRTRIVAGWLVRLEHGRRSARIHPVTGDEFDLAYDTVVVTAGAVTRTFPVPGILENAIGLKTVEEAVAVRDHVLTAFDRASTLPDGSERARLLTITVVGGGFSGVEAFGELLGLTRSLLRHYPEIRYRDLHLHLVEAAGRILPEVTDEPGAWVVRHLRRRGGLVHLGTQVTSAVDGRIVLSDGEQYDSGLIVWAAGNAANPVIASRVDLPIDARGLVPVLPDLRVADAHGRAIPDAWAAGDAAAVPDLVASAPGARTVPNAQHAVRQAKRLAKNIVATMHGEQPVPYRHHSLGVVATLGIGHGIFQYRRIVIRGPVAWLMHRGYHVLAIPSFERKLRVLLVWISALVFGRDIVSLTGARDPRRPFVSAGDPDAAR